MGLVDCNKIWLDALVKAGVVPPETCRIIIDLNVGHGAKVFYECWADERMFQIDPTKMLQGANVISVTEAAYPAPITGGT